MPMNINLTGSAFTDMLMPNVGSSPFQLSHDWFTKQDLVIRTQPLGAGTTLIPNTDYNVQTENTTLSAEVSTAIGSTRNVFHIIQVTNTAYQAINLYISGLYIGDTGTTANLNWSNILGVPTASIATSGVVKVDGSSITVNSSGVISVSSLANISTNIIPSINGIYDLGSSAPFAFRSLYLGMPGSAGIGGVYFVPVGTSGDVARIYGASISGSTEVHFQIGAGAADKIVFETETGPNAVLTISGVGNVTIPGNLTVSGTTTTVSSQNVDVTSTEMIINFANPGISPIGETGIRVRRAKNAIEGDQDAKLIWNEGSGRWQAVCGSDGATTATIVVCSQGTAFPSVPAFADEFYRTDLDEWFKYNGSTWTQI
jgi:hypothetical protein